MYFARLSCCQILQCIFVFTLLDVGLHAAKEDDFPCKVDKNTTLHLHGENHQNKVHLKKREQLIDKANQRKIVLGLEGSSRVKFFTINYKPINFRARIYGIDETIPFGLAILMQAYRDSDENIRRHFGKGFTGTLIIEGLKSRLHGQFGDGTSFANGNKYTRMAWKKLRTEEKFQDADVEKIAKLFDEFYDLQDRNKVARIILKLPDTHPYNAKPKKVFSLFPKLALVYAKILKEKYAKEAMLPDSFLDKVKSALKRQDGQSRNDYSHLILEWRNLFMAKRIAAIYCVAVDSALEPHIVVGDRHRKGLVEILKKRAPELKITSKSF